MITVIVAKLENISKSIYSYDPQRHDSNESNCKDEMFAIYEELGVEETRRQLAK